MATFAIGDIQGCFTELQLLLELIHFDASVDRLWFTGDLVNRGNQSLEVVRFVKNLGSGAITTLGNHELHFLAVASGCKSIREKDTFHDLLNAPDLESLVAWIRNLPLMHYDEKFGFAMVHAGLAPAWDLREALALAHEVETVLRSEKYVDLLMNMYGNNPDQWMNSLTGWGRLRIIVNYFTRMRYVDSAGHLDLNYKGPIGCQPKGFYPWFSIPERKSQSLKLLFGHWASLQGKVDVPNVFALDTGCCWGNCLTAMRLDDGVKFYIDCHSRAKSGLQQNDEL